MKPAILCLVLGSMMVLTAAVQEPFQSWPLSKAVQILNASPWARQETYTQVISGVGSGVSGEKEIFNTFFIRFVSAPPIREALLRVQQIEYGYATLSPENRFRFDEHARENVLWGSREWIVVAVSFRSNDPNQESNVRRFFQRSTAETLQNKAFLSTDRFSQVRLRTYFPPRDEGLGAKFVFPREIDGTPIVVKNDRHVSFELLDVPAASPRLRARFAVQDMVVGGQPVL